MALSVLPRFCHAAWFEAAFFTGIALLLWIGFLVRVRCVASAIKIRAQEDADERIRIARESYDTLLQGLQGLLLNFHLAAQTVPPEYESRKALDRALAPADSIIIDARDRFSRS